MCARLLLLVVVVITSLRCSGEVVAKRLRCEFLYRNTSALSGQPQFEPIQKRWLAFNKRRIVLPVSNVLRARIVASV